MIAAMLDAAVAQAVSDQNQFDVADEMDNIILEETHHEYDQDMDNQRGKVCKFYAVCVKVLKCCRY